MNIIVVSFDNHNLVRVLRAMMMIVMITVMMVVMAVAGVWDGIRGTTTVSDVAVHRVDVSVRSRPGSFLCRFLCWSMLAGLMRFVMRGITPR